MYTFQHHYRDNFFTRIEATDDTPIHCMGRNDDSPTFKMYIVIDGRGMSNTDSRCSCCALNIEHTERKHEANMAHYYLTHPA